MPNDGKDFIKKLQEKLLGEYFINESGRLSAERNALLNEEFYEEERIEIYYIDDNPDGTRFYICPEVVAKHRENMRIYRRRISEITMLLSEIREEEDIKEKEREEARTNEKKVED